MLKDQRVIFDVYEKYKDDLPTLLDALEEIAINHSYDLDSQADSSTRNNIFADNESRRSSSSLKSDLKAA